MLLVSTPVTFSNDVKRCLALEVKHELNELELEDDEELLRVRVLPPKEV